MGQPIPFQNAQVMFTGGLAQKTAELIVQPNNVLALDNVRIAKAGQIDKRPGFTSLSQACSDGTTLSTIAALATFNGELLAFDGTRCLSYLESTATWVPKGRAMSVVTTQHSVIRSSTSVQSNPDGCPLDGLELYAWEDSRGGIRYAVFESTTGAQPVVDQSLYPAGSQPKVVQDGTDFHVFVSVSLGTVGHFTIAPGAPQNPSQVAAWLSDRSLPCYDAVMVNGSPWVVYPGPSVVQARDATQTFALGAGVTGITAIATCTDSTGRVWVAAAYSSGTLVVGAFTSTGGVALVPTTIATEAVGPTTITIAENPAAPGTVLVADEVPLSASNHLVNVWPISAAGAVTNIVNGNATPSVTIRGVGLASKLFSYGAQAYVTTVYPSTLQPTYFVHALSTTPAQAPVCKLNFQVGGGFRTNSLLAECQPMATASDFLLAAQRAGSFQTLNGVAFANLGVNGNTIALADADAFQATQSTNNLFIPGGVPLVYDGANVVELATNVFPEDIQVAIVSQPAAILNGAYQYTVTYEWTDNYGQVQYSQPSVATASTTITPNNAFQLTVPTLRLTSKTSVQIVFYRTVVIAGAPQLIPYKVGSVTNNPLVDSVTFVDFLPDASAQENPSIYSLSQVPNTAPPSCSLAVSWQNRVFISGLDDPAETWFSLNRFDVSDYNNIALSFSSEFTCGVDGDNVSSVGGPITALAREDANFIIFKANGIYVLTGSGPNPNNTGDQYPDPQLITSDTGCTNQASIVFCPLGLMFKSEKGIYLLDRNLSLRYIGDRVEGFNGLTITSAELLNDTNEVVFATAEGTLLVYNYYFDVWSTWSTVPAVDAVMWNNQLVVAQANGVCKAQDNTGTVWSDDGKAIVMTVQTPWLSPANLMGYANFYSFTVLGVMRGPHTLVASASYDFNPGIDENFTAASSAISASWGALPTWGTYQSAWGGTFQPYEFQFNISSTRHQAVSVTLKTRETAPNQAVSLIGISLQYLTYPGAMRLPTVARVAGT